VQIESVAAVDQVERIAAVDGVDALMVGPGDLALSAGLRPGVDAHHPAMVALCDRVLACNLPTGTFALLGESDVERAVAAGWDFFVTCLDRVALTSRAAALRTEPPIRDRAYGDGEVPAGRHPTANARTGRRSAVLRREG
jgi:4-hydroxy-2-oxoheptanedioate aldolase